MRKHFIIRKLLCLIVSLVVFVSPFSYGQFNNETIIFAKTKSVHLNKRKMTLNAGKSFVLRLEGAKKKVKWFSDKPEIARVSKIGKVTAKNPGKAVITAKIGKNVLRCLIKVKREFTEKEVKMSILALKKKYPEGKKWTNDNSYYSESTNTVGYGCAGFAFLLSDAAFGKKRRTKVYRDLSNIGKKIRIGDILRINHDSHSVVVIGKTDKGIKIAEGNYNFSIHRGGQLTYDEIEKIGTYFMTRY